MKNLDWSIVLWAEVSCAMRGRTRETRDEALDEADAVCSARTVVLWAMHALGGTVSICILSLKKVNVLKQRRRSRRRRHTGDWRCLYC